MSIWTALFVLAMFGIGYALGAASGNLKSKLAQFHLEQFFVTVRSDMMIDPNGPFRQSQTVRLVRDRPYDWLDERED